MALSAIYSRGKIEDQDVSQRKYRHLRPRPALLTSFSARTGAMVLGLILAAAGVLFIIVLATERLNFGQTALLVIGVFCLPVGIWMMVKGLHAFGKTARPHKFFYYDHTRVVAGTTQPIGQDEIKRIRRARLPEKAQILTALAPGFIEIPVKDIESIDVRVEKVKLSIDKLTIKGAGREISVDLDALLPSMNFSTVNGNNAFNFISQFYSQATGKTVTASIENR